MGEQWQGARADGCTDVEEKSAKSGRLTGTCADHAGAQKSHAGAQKSHTSAPKSHVGESSFFAPSPKPVCRSFYVKSHQHASSKKIWLVLCFQNAPS